MTGNTFSVEAVSDEPAGKGLGLPGARFLKDLRLGTKLTIGFGFLVALTLLAAVASYLGSYRATQKIDITDDVRVPTALVAAHAQADLLRMLGDVRGYLALGDQEFRESYNRSSLAFKAELDELQKLVPNLNPENIPRVYELESAYKQWLELPEKLFELRDDQMDREPAYRLLATEGTKLAGAILIAINSMIELQSQREPTADHFQVLGEMAKFQGSFTSMFSGLRGYVTTRNRIYRQEYDVNLAANSLAWDKLFSRKPLMSQSQETMLDGIAKKREEFLKTIPDKVFELLESERWREDLFIFRTKAIPLADQMQKLLEKITEDQQMLLRSELAEGRRDLFDANRIIITGGLIALMSCMVLAWLSSRNIVGPVRRLTSVAEQIHLGDLGVRATVESGDEIGILAKTFNAMTDQLRQTLLQVKKEKNRADNLLEVVIPLGVQLSSEKDFNRLLEKILQEAKSTCNADAGALYLKTEDNRLKYVIYRNDSQEIALGGTSGRKISLEPISLLDPSTGQPNHSDVTTHVALSGVSVNIGNTAEAGEFVFSTPSPTDGPNNEYSVTSLLTIPLKNSRDKVLGVLQLFNAREPESRRIVAFDRNLQQLMESFSLLAVAALEAYIREQSLKNEIEQLKIEIDEAKRQKQVSEIVESEFFQDLRAKARGMRKRSSDKSRGSDETSGQ